MCYTETDLKEVMLLCSHMHGVVNRADIFKHCVMAHWCVKSGSQMGIRNLGEGHLLVRLMGVVE